MAINPSEIGQFDENSLNKMKQLEAVIDICLNDHSSEKEYNIVFIRKRNKSFIATIEGQDYRVGELFISPKDLTLNERREIIKRYKNAGWKKVCYHKDSCHGSSFRFGAEQSL